MLAYDVLLDLDGTYANQDGAQQAHDDWMAMSDDERDMAMDAAELEYEAMRDAEMEQMFAVEDAGNRERMVLDFTNSDDIPF